MPIVQSLQDETASPSKPKTLLQPNASLIESLASLPSKEQQAFLATLTDEDAEFLLWDWNAWARPNQLSPEHRKWLVWVILAGRGYGKTRAGAEWVRKQVYAGKRRIALVAETHKDLEEVMVYGESGLANVFPPHERPHITSKPMRITFHTGAVALGYNATEPGQLRGPQFDAAWCDELAKWKKARDTWDMLQFALRLGEDPQALVTTTPQPIPVLKEILKDPDTVVTKGSTYENRTNLAGSFLRKVEKRYGGTRLGRQELDAELLDDLPGALWTRENLDNNRVVLSDLPEMRRIVVAVDPSGTSGEEDDGDSIGIVVAGLGMDERGYVLADRTCKLSPDGWGREAVAAYYHFLADKLVAERNFGGAMVEHVIRTIDKNVNYQEVTASRGKIARAEPVAALYEQNRVSHLPDLLELEDQMCNMAASGYAGEGSPDRMDAAVWALTDLMLGDSDYNLWNM